jgi:biofilm PGA synthesis N-glycosyltransferase PgaC
MFSPALAVIESAMWLEFTYWLCVVVAVYPYLGYPVIAFLMARLHARSVELIPADPQPVSLIVAAHNEAQRIGKRIVELSRIVAAVHPQSEVIVVSDGSTDGTAQIVRSSPDARIRLIELPVNRGKAQALNRGVAAAQYDVVAFADVRQTWDDDTLPWLLQRFADPQVGAVSGDLHLRTGNGTLASVNFYWRLEKCLRVNESCWYSSIGVTGAVSAVRRSLFQPLPPGTVLDDVYWPLAVVLQGWRVVHESRAVAHDQLPEDIRGEYQRKLRTLAGNFQLLSSLPSLLVPWKNPVWFQFISHKVLRLATPWLLLLAWGLAFALAGKTLYAGLSAMQTLGMAVGLLAWHLPPLRRFRPLGIIAAVFALNYAAWLAFWVWLSGSTTRTWKKVAYTEADANAVP